MRALAALLLVGCAPLIGGTARVLPVQLQDDPRGVAEPPLQLVAPPPERIVLEGGGEVVWARRESPVVNLTVFARCGRFDEPPGLAGLTSFTWSAALGAGDVRTAIDQKRAQRAIAFDPRVLVDDGDSLATVTVLRSNFTAAVRLFAEALQQPRFEPVAIAELRALVRQRLDAPARARDDLIQRVLTDEGSVGRFATPESLSSLTPDLLAAHAARCFVNEDLAFAVSGDLSEEELRRAFGAFTRRGVAVRHPPAPPPPPGRQVWLMPDVGSRRVDVAILARTRPLTPQERVDGLAVMAVLGSALVSELREELGQVYSVDSDVEVGPGFGVAVLRFSTRRAEAFAAVRRALALLERLWQQWPVSSERVDRLRDVLVMNEARADSFGRAFEAARMGLIEGAGADPRPMSERLREVSSSRMAGFFSLAFPPGKAQLVITGDLDSTLPWSEFGAVRAP